MFAWTPKKQITLVVACGCIAASAMILTSSGILDGLWQRNQYVADEQLENIPLPTDNVPIPSLTIDDLSSSTVTRNSSDYYTVTGNGLTLRGTVSPNVTKIVVSHQRENEHVLTRFKPGDERWEYNARLNLGNLHRGRNDYEIRAYAGDGSAPAIMNVVVVADVYENVVTEESGHIEIAWHEPTKVSTPEFFNGLSLEQDGIDLIMQYEPIFDASMSGKTLAQRMNLMFEIHETGYVSSGRYEGDTVYHVKVVQDGMCGGDPSDYHRILRSPGNRLTLLERYSDGMDGRLYELLPFIVDKTVTMNLLPPEEIRIPQSNLLLRRHESFNMFSKFTSPQALFTDKYLGATIMLENGCFVSKHPDTTFSTFLIDFPVRRDPTSAENADALRQSKITRIGEGILDITWNDGAPNSTQYVSREYFGGFGAGCTYQFENIVDGKLQSSSQFPGERALEQIGTTSWGEPVYRERYSPSELATFVPNDRNYEERYRLFAAYDSYYAETKPTIEVFYDMKPIIYIRDPFGHYLRFIDINVAPAAEMCKPVVYLYPEEETDVAVSVAPKGGFLLTIPEHGDGWNVRAAPDGTITDHADGQTYPYLFWEGFTSPGYLMHNEGFVLSREQISCGLPALLHSQGLRGKEITDFMEYWKPLLSEKPYYFLTFMPQELFEREAPMSVEPRPDTVIRVFMDYQGLDEPVPVKPQRFSPPERIGFTVIEWGGAKH